MAQLNNCYILQAADMTGTCLSQGIDLTNYFIGAIQAVWTGSPVGNILLQVSCDPVFEKQSYQGTDQAANVVNWSDYTLSIQPVSGAGDFAWNLNFLGFKWVRLKYIPTSGSGSLSVAFNGKGG